ncbi:sensor histidine kinase [Methyloparacoccus murrellii]
MRRRAQSLRTQLLLRLSGPLLLVVLLDVAVSYFVALHYANLAYDRWLLDSARSLAQQVKSYRDRITFELPPIAVEVFRWDAMDKTFFKIESRASGFMAGDRALPSPDLRELMPEEPYFSDRLMQGEEVRVVSVVAMPGVSGAEVVVSVAETLHKRRGMLEEMLLAVVLPQLLLVCITVFHVWTSVRLGLRPLADLSRLIDSRSARDLTPIPDADVPLEVRSLTHRLNALLERLGGALASQQRFIENAAHQLRTPLAGLKLQAERAARARDMATLQPALEHIQHAADRVAHLGSQLLALAHSEFARQAQREPTRLDMAALAREVCLEWVPRALERGMELALEAPDGPVEVNGDALLLRELLGNLLDNALRYGGGRGAIEVSVTAAVAGPVLGIADAGPGIPPSEAGRVTERFYRIPGSPGDGCGLGLAIVKEIADRHRAELAIGTGPRGGACIAVRFPAPASVPAAGQPIVAEA